MEEKLTEALLHLLKIAWIPILEVAAGMVLGPRIKHMIVKIADKSYNAKNKGLLTFLGSAANILIIALSFILAAEALGLKMNSIISLITALGLGIALALKGNMANVAGGLQILITKPFGVGDYIKISGHSGIVTAIELMFTTIRTDNQKEVVVPNSTIVEDIVTNYSKYPAVRIRIPFVIPSGNDFVAIQTTVQNILNDSPLILHDHPSEVVVSTISDGYITMQACGYTTAVNHHFARNTLLEQIALSLPFLQSSGPSNIKIVSPDYQAPAKSPETIAKENEEARVLIDNAQSIALKTQEELTSERPAASPLFNSLNKNLHHEIEKVATVLTPGSNHSQQQPAEGCLSKPDSAASENPEDQFSSITMETESNSAAGSKAADQTETDNPDSAKSDTSSA